MPANGQIQGQATAVATEARPDGDRHVPGLARLLAEIRRTDRMLRLAEADELADRAPDS